MREDIKQTLQKLKPLIGKKAEALWYLYQSSDYKEKHDVEVKINLIAEKYLKTFQDKIELPPLEKNEAAGDLKIGEITYIDKSLCGFELRKDVLKRVGKAAVIMSCVPALFEIGGGYGPGCLIFLFLKQRFLGLYWRLFHPRLWFHS